MFSQLIDGTHLYELETAEVYCQTHHFTPMIHVTDGPADWLFCDICDTEAFDKYLASVRDPRRRAQLRRSMANRAAPEIQEIDGVSDVHTFFGLTYASYLVVPRVLLQSMPEEWQAEFVKLVSLCDEAFHHIDRPVSYRVQPVDEKGRFMREPLPGYSRGRTVIEPLILDHLWIGIAGHPDDPECSVCGAPKLRHRWHD